MKKLFLTIAACAGLAAWGADLTDVELAVRNLNRAMDIADASWETSIKGSDSNLYMADSYNLETGVASGPSDIWPLTAAVEAHCSILEALEAVKDVDAALYGNTWDLYRERLELLIDNLEYYRGSYRRPSYATANKEWKPYAVPRSNTRGGANVTGILNVYDDQMWLSRELIRAYRVTGNEDYRDLAAYLADYVIDGWDCWRDENGEEYGGITWGPGYNSKHACSNAPIIQPLVWLSEIYEGSGEEMEFYYRDGENAVKHESRERSELYLEFARKVYDWQLKHLFDRNTGVYWDMMGADNTIQVSRGYRQHVDCGGPTGTFFSYNTGTMIAGGAELYRVTGEERYRTEMSVSVKGAMNRFTRYIRKLTAYVFNTDETAMSGFNTWFNDVLVRALADAEEFCENSSATTGLKSTQTVLDYAFENHNRGNMLPIKLVDGWGDDNQTKAFHQFSFASEYAVLAKRLMKNQASDGVENVAADREAVAADGMVYTLGGVALGHMADVEGRLPQGVYVTGGKKMVVR